MVDKLCPNCGVPIGKWRKSCSVFCANELRKKPSVPCARPGCDKTAAKTHGSSKYCSYECFNLHRLDKSCLNVPSCPDGVRAVPLTQGKWALVDDADYERVSAHNWCAVKVGTPEHPIWYAKDSRTMQYMHAFILGVNRGSDTECLHGPGGTLNNTRVNLRSGSRRENQRDRGAGGSTSRYKGVGWNSRAAKWTAHIMAGDEYYFLGYHASDVDAAIAYDDAARRLHRQFARFNFPGPGQVSAIGKDVDRKCVHCNSAFRGPENLEYCCLKCVVQSHIPTRSCLDCGSSILGYRKFCDDNCKSSFMVKCDLAPPPDPIIGASWVKLTLGKYCLVDNGDIPIIGQYKWHAKESNGVWYACRNAGVGESQTHGNVVRMHRFLMNLVKGDDRDVGHADGNGLNNRRSNLYLTDNSCNHMNVALRGASGFKGVSQLSDGAFLAKICARGRYEYLGRFDTSAAAAKAYDNRARQLHGKHGRYNFPLDGERSAK